MLRYHHTAKKCYIVVGYTLKANFSYYLISECSGIAVLVRLRACHAATLRTLSGLDQFRN